jgi:hypothetical protein
VWKATFDTDEWRAAQAAKPGNGKLDAVYFIDSCPLVVDEGIEMKNPNYSPKIERTIKPETFERCVKSLRSTPPSCPPSHLRPL